MYCIFFFSKVIGLMRRNLKSIHQGKSIESWIPLKWKVGDEWWVCLIDGCLFWIGGWGDQSGRPNSMPPDVVCTCGSMSSCGVEMWLPKSNFAFYGWHGYKGARHMPTTSVPDGLGCLNRGRVAFHQWTSIPSLKLGRSSPEISGDGPVHPRVALPRFGDRWDLFLKALQRVRYFHISLLKGLFSKYLFVVFSNISFFEGQSLGNPIVTDVQPRRIGYGGGAVTIHGQVKIFTSFKKLFFLFRDFPKMFSASLTPY